MPFLPSDQWRQSTEGKSFYNEYNKIINITKISIYADIPLLLASFFESLSVHVAIDRQFTCNVFAFAVLYFFSALTLLVHDRKGVWRVNISCQQSTDAVLQKTHGDLAQSVRFNDHFPGGPGLADTGMSRVLYGKNMPVKQKPKV